jgi:hypothetical protein
MMEEVNIPKTYCKKFCKYHNVHPEEQHYNKSKSKDRKKRNKNPTEKYHIK